jgi:hypothetical protein
MTSVSTASGRFALAAAHGKLVVRLAPPNAPSGPSRRRSSRWHERCLEAALSPLPKEAAGPALGAMLTTSSMGARIVRTARWSDLFFALPTWSPSSLCLICKPVVPAKGPCGCELGMPESGRL